MKPVTSPYCCHRILKLLGATRQIMSSRSMSQGSDQNQKLFVGEKHAKDYARFRPTYPDALFETIFNYCKTNPTGNDLALDIGCGSGQSTLPLTKYFSQVIGLDVSPSQISNCPTNMAGLSFQVSPAEDLSIAKDKSVDLITIGQALHWIQLDRFYSEVNRILKPGGSIVAYGYGILMIDHPEASDYLRDIYHNRFSKYWASGRAHIDDGYSSLPSPYSKWLRNDDLVIEKYLTVEDLVGYMDSSSAIQTLKKQSPNYDLVGEVREKLSLICHQEGRKTFKVTWPIFVLMSQKPTS